MEIFSFAVCLLLVSASSAAITFDGLKSSFAQYERWQPSSSSLGVVGRLSLHFKTHLKDSLLLYQDNGRKDYFTIELSEGKVIATFGVARKSVKIEIGQDLDDVNWHILVVQLNGSRAVLTLDKTHIKAANNLPRNGALINTSGYLYIGGLPRSLILSSLSWMGAAFKKGFVGCIKKLMLTNDANNLDKAVLMMSKGTKSGCLNKCRARNPCLNNGKCINRFSEAKCDCTGTGFDGEKCDKEIIQIHLSKGDYIIYDMSSNPVATKSDTIRIKFKTFKKNAHLLKTNFADDYVNVKLSKGLVVVEWNLGSGQLTMTVKNKKVNDNQWHELSIKRINRDVTAQIDNGDETKGTTPARHSTFNMHGGDVSVYIGSDGTSRKQFEGCLKAVVFNGVELVRQLKAKDVRLSVNGNVQWTCVEAPTTQPSTSRPQTTPPNPTKSRSRHWERKVIPSTTRHVKSTRYTKKKHLKPTAHFRKTTECSPNDVKCALVTFPITQRPKPTPKKIQTNKKLSERPITEEIDNPTDSTDNGTTTSKPQVEGLADSSELGNVPTAIGLVAGSIVLFAICAFISVKLKKRRDRKSHAHQITIETREVDEMIDNNEQVYKPDSYANNS